MKNVFIDGSAGTTGLRIAQRLKERGDIHLLTLPEDRRKGACSSSPSSAWSVLSA